jgi:hypothetical protein
MDATTGTDANMAMPMDNGTTTNTGGTTDTNMSNTTDTATNGM